MRRLFHIGAGLCCAAALAACGGGGDDETARAPDNDDIPTATLPAELPTPIFVRGGAVQPDGARTYTIRSGDTLAGVADRFGLSLEELLDANPELDPASLSVGDVVQLPALPEGAPPATDETPPAEPTSANTPVADTPAPAVPTDTPVPLPTDTPAPAPTATPVPLGQAYVVQSGDIPVSIAAKFGITVEALLAANPGIDATGLQVGQVLIIPPPPADG